jgi:phospholipid transport system substrate-binding protein
VARTASLKWVLLLFALISGAQAGAAAQAPDAAIRSTTDRLRELIRQNRAAYEKDSKRYYAMVEDVVVSRFDAPYIGQIILGPAWRDATPEQRTRFINAFRNNLVHTYARTLLEHADSVQVQWKPVHMAEGATDAEVKADILRDAGPPVPLGFSVHKVGADWKVYDVKIDSVSLATTYRSQFTPEIKKNGLDGLIKRLETLPLEKVPARKSGGAA